MIYDVNIFPFEAIGKGKIEKKGSIKQIHISTLGIKERKLDRDRRMMPARQNSIISLIENRMHKEYVITLIKE